MPRLDEKDVFHLKLINKTLQQITDYENKNKYSQNPKIQEKSAGRECRDHLNHNLFSENVINEPLTDRFFNANGRYQY